MARRRALSTIVGALIFVALLVASFSSLLTAMNFMTSFQQESIKINDKNFDQLSEDFGMRAIVDTSCVLDVEIVNSGTAAVKIEDIFLVVDPTSTSSTTTRYDVTNMVVPSQVRKNATDGVTSTITLTTSKEYQVKVITELGTVKEKYFATGTSCGSTSLVGQLIVIPPEIATSDKVTVAFVVVNREDFAFRNVAVASSTLTVSPSSTATAQSMLTGSSEANLVAGGSAVFMWSVTLEGGIGQVITFSTSATANHVDIGDVTTGTETATVKITKEFTNSLVSSRLVAKPEVFIVTPGPFGESGQKGLWGAVIVNPTDTTIRVNRLTFVLNTVGSESSQNLVETACTDDGIIPDIEAEWSCPNENLIDWKDDGDALTYVDVGARDAKAFLVIAKPGSTGTGGNDIAAFTTSVSVLSSSGQFSKGNYASSMEGSSGGGPIANVYLTTQTTDAAALTLSTTATPGYTSMSATATPQTVRVAVANFDSGTQYIPSGSKLVVNIPAGFTLTAPTTPQAKFTVTTTEYADGSNQIVATLTENIGGGAAEAALLTFEIDPPSTLEETRVYVMYCLLDGNSSTALGLSATAEIPIRVTVP